MTKPEHCNVAGCNQDAISSLESQALCRQHFIAVCYTRIERYEETQKCHSLTIADADSMWRFIHECTQQADEIEHATEDVDDLERAKLLDIIFSASDLGRHLRRSTRKAASIAVRLRCDKLGGAWQEDTETVLLSRYGASVLCSHPAKPGESLQVIRSDTGQRAQARVTWQRPSGDERIRIGLEFVDCDNFWGLDWAAVEEAR